MSLTPFSRKPADHEPHWDRVVQESALGQWTQWRRQSDLVNAKLLERWLSPMERERVLKTDLFDEVAGKGVYPLLQAHANHVVGMDISARAVAAAQERYPALEAVQADVRALPFPDAHFDSVFSPSTLDHMDNHADVATALAELARVLRPGGRLLVTLDNPLNPLIALRNVLPKRLARALRQVPYGSGWTCGPRRLRSLLEESGFEVREMTAVLHFPRFIVARVERIPMRALHAAERLERLPTRYLTGHFVAALAQRKS